MKIISKVVKKPPASPPATNGGPIKRRIRRSRPAPRVLADGVAQVATMLGVSRNTVYGMVNAGELPTIRFGKSGMIRIPIAAVEKLIADAMESDKAPSSKREMDVVVRA